MGEKDTSFILEEMVTVYGKGNGRLYGDVYQIAGNKFSQQCIRLQETNSDNSVSDCRK